MYLQIFKSILLLIVALILTQCFIYSPDWQIPESTDRETDIDGLLQEADTLVQNADNKEKLMDTILFRTVADMV